MDDTPKKSTPCANLRVSGCTNIVVDRGNILCSTCIGNRKNMLQKKRVEQEEKLLYNAKHLEQQLTELQEEHDQAVEKYTTIISDLENHKKQLYEELESLERQYRMRISQLNKEKEQMNETYQEELELLDEQAKNERKQLALKNQLLNIKNQELNLEKNELFSKWKDIEKEVEQQEQVNKKLSSINEQLLKENETMKELKNEVEKLKDKTKHVRNYSKNSISTNEYIIHSEPNLRQEKEKRETQNQTISENEIKTCISDPNSTKASRLRAEAIRKRLRRMGTQTLPISRLDTKNGKRRTNSYIDRFKSAVEDNLPDLNATVNLQQKKRRFINGARS